MVRHLFDMWGRPQIDLFALPSNTHLPLWYGWTYHPETIAPGALLQPWTGLSLCCSPVPIVTQEISEANGGQGRGSYSHSPHVAEEVLLHPLAPDGLRDSMPPVTQHVSPVTVAAGQGHALLLRPEDPQVDGLDVERQTLDVGGLSEDVIDKALASTKPTLLQVYDDQWQAFVGWCDGQGFNPIHATVGQVLDFLQKSKLVQLNRVLDYVTAISNRYAPVDRFLVLTRS